MVVGDEMHLRKPYQYIISPLACGTYIAAMLLFTLQLEALEITPTSPLVPYINWLYPRTQAEF